MRSTQLRVLPFDRLRHEAELDSYWIPKDCTHPSSVVILDEDSVQTLSANVFDEAGEILAAGEVQLGAYVELIETLSQVPGWAMEMTLDGAPYGLITRTIPQPGSYLFAAHREQWPAHADGGAWFGPECLIMTDQGEQPAEWIEPGTLIATRDHGLQPVKAVLRAAANQLIDVPAFGTLEDELRVSADGFVALDKPSAKNDVAQDAGFTRAGIWPKAQDSSGHMVALIFPGHEVIQTPSGIGLGSWLSEPAAMGSLDPMNQLLVLRVQGVAHRYIAPARPFMPNAQMHARRFRKNRVA